MALERDIVKQIKDYVKEQGGFVVKYHGGPYAEVGVPDLLIALHGTFIGCEVKLPGHFPTAVQLQKLKEIQQAGGIGIWCDSLESFKQKLEDACG